jgi:hypothetical protein
MLWFSSLGVFQIQTIGQSESSRPLNIASNQPQFHAAGQVLDHPTESGA